MDTSDLTPGMQEMLAEMAAMRAELNQLKARANGLTSPQIAQSAKPTVSNTRRTVLRKLAGGLLAGLVVGSVAVAMPEQAQAKFVAAGTAGAIVVPPGVPTPTGAVANTYGLIASADTTSLNLSTLPNTSIGVYANGGYYGVYGNAVYYGVYGSGITGVTGTGIGNGSVGVSGTGSDKGIYGVGTNIGVYGLSDNTGVYGVSFGNGSSPFGVSGFGPTGVRGTGTDKGTTGVSGLTTLDNCTAVSGVATGPGSNGIFGQGTQYAGAFAGAVLITGALSKGGGSFKIDHPLDPENKYLYHSFVESPDMMNIYNGLATLDDHGEATVTMPDWFKALNSDFRYQLTSIGVSMPGLFIAEKMANLKFKIGGGHPGQEVSWQVTGIRQDAWANANRIPVEEDKAEHQKGKYLHPEVFGKSDEQKISL